MLLVSFLAGITLLLLTGTGSIFHILLSVALGALAGTVTELYSPNELDTVTVPVVILAVCHRHIPNAFNSSISSHRRSVSSHTAEA